MRMLVFFDLPVETAQDRRNYRAFRQMLIKNGFIMLQKSVYCKLMTSPAVESSVRNLLRENKPPRGFVQLLSVTEKQFSRMEYVLGEYVSEVISSGDGVIVL